jgi:signal transduction histidine kinase
VLAEGGFGHLTPSQQNAVVILIRAELRLEHLIEDLIQFSLASKGQLALSILPVDLDQLITGCADLAARRAALSEIKLITSFPRKIPEVLGDEEKIRWVIEQLLDNALKFTPKGGTVEIRTDVGEDRVAILVSDTGIGISQDDVEAIFEPFHQLDGSPTRRYGGTGLGLALCRRIIEAHSSSLEVDSELGRGSTFSFSLPAAPHE